MKPPDKCDLCGTFHHEHQAHIFKDGPRNQSITTTVTNARNPPVTAQVVQVACNQCVTKDAEIARLKQELARLAQSVIEAAPPGPNALAGRMKKAKRDRASYMRDYRSRGKEA